MASQIESLLEYVLKVGGSELIVTEGSVSAVRLASRVCSITDSPVVEFGTLHEFLGSLEGEAGSMMGGPWAGARWRVRYFREALGNAAVFRPLLEECPNFDALGAPQMMNNLLGYSSGLVVFSGPPCSGKTMTATAFVGAMCESRILRASFLDENGEIPVKSGDSLVLRDSSGTVSEKIEQGLRSGTDLFWLGDFDGAMLLPMLRAAEAGSLVVVNVTAGNSAGVLDALLSAASPADRDRARAMLAACLKAVVVQRLLPGAAENVGAVPAWEILYNTQNVASFIRNGELFRLPSVIASAASEGMLLMDDCLAELVRSGYVAYEEAQKYVANPARLG